MFERYRELRSKIDNECVRLEKIHSAFMTCKKGCSQCCMDFSILPVEYYAIKEELKEFTYKGIEEGSDGRCGFLEKSICSIYPFRPIICRTHGLPLLYMNDNDWELSLCELTFTEYGGEFDFENTYSQDKFNSELFMINQEFLKHEAFSHFSEKDLIPVSRLLSDSK